VGAGSTTQNLCPILLSIYNGLKLSSKPGSFVTLDSGGDRDANSAKTVVRSTSISVRPSVKRARARAATTHRCRFYSKLCGLGPACQQTHSLSRPVAVSCYDTHPLARRLVPSRLRHHSCCRYTHAHPQQRRAARQLRLIAVAAAFTRGVQKLPSVLDRRAVSLQN